MGKFVHAFVGVFIALSASAVLANAATLDGAEVDGDADNDAAVSILAALAGNYQVVAVRRSGLVAAPLDLTPGVVASVIGQSVRIDAKGIGLDGISCADWKLTKVEGVVDIALEPILADLRLPPLSADVSQGDRRIGDVFDVACEGEHFTTLYQADNRVLAMSWDNSASYLILEKPLNTVQAETVINKLVDMKFMETPDAPLMEAAMLAGLRAYYAYRATDRDAPVPLRPAITENLLDGILAFSN